MSRRHAIAVVLALAVSGCDNQCNSQPETEQLFWRGKCGPDATLMASVDRQCHVDVSGADQADLPQQGTLNGTGSQPASALWVVGVNLFSTDGGVLYCLATPADGGLSVGCHQPCPGVDAGDNCDLECDGFFYKSAPP